MSYNNSSKTPQDDDAALVVGDQTSNGCSGVDVDFDLTMPACSSGGGSRCAQKLLQDCLGGCGTMGRWRGIEQSERGG